MRGKIQKGIFSDHGMRQDGFLGANFCAFLPLCDKGSFLDDKELAVGFAFRKKDVSCV